MPKAGRDLVLAFVSGLLVTAGAELGKYLVAQLVKPRPPTGGDKAFPGTPTTALCPRCGRGMTQYSKTLYCSQCGHKEG